MRLLLLITIITISGCEVCWMEPDQKERQRIFKECMQLLPTGPQYTHYNDWAEVVAECEDAARQQASVKKCSGAQ